MINYMKIRKNLCKRILEFLTIAVLYINGNIVQANDVYNFADLQHAMSSKAAIIDLKTSIEAEADIKTTSASSLTVNGNGFYLDGKGTYKGINFYNYSESFALNTGNGITFKNLNNAIYVSSLSSDITSGNNTVFSNNKSTALSNGGAIRNYAENDALTTIGDNAVFSDNVAEYEGGAIFNQSYSTIARLIIGNNAIFSNNATTGNQGYGGAIYNESQGTDSLLTIGDNASFSSNTALQHGGAVYNSSYNGADALFTIGNNASFSDNVSGQDGGAIHNYANNNSELTIGYNATFSGNTADTSGGAIYNIGRQTSKITIGNNAVFSNNTARFGYGGAIYNQAYAASEIIIGDNTVFSNNTTMLESGGAIYNENYGTGSGTIIITTTGGTTSFIDNTAKRKPNDIYMQGSNSKLNIDGNSGTVYFGGGIEASAGQINKSNNGNLTFGEKALNENFMGSFNQTGGTTTIHGQFFNNAAANNIANSNLNFFQDGADYGKINVLNLDTVNVSSKNHKINAVNAGTVHIAGANNFKIDVNGRHYDTFAADGINGSGIINISELNFIVAPTESSIDLNIFQSSDIDAGIDFTTDVGEIITPVYKYKFKSLQDEGRKGEYRLYTEALNKEIFRGQIAKLAAYQNQLSINNMLFDHIYIDVNEQIALASRAYPCAAGAKTFAPYRLLKKDGDIWAKTYVDFGKLHMDYGINATNNAYGQIIGADFPVVEIAEDWNFLTTAYISYNGGHQTFNGVSVYQNGGQGGFMGSFTNGDFIGSVLAYAGGYHNKMSAMGSSENTNNWFAGTAFKTAHNFRPAKNFIIQPNLLASYNIFGRQNWYSDNIKLNMSSDLLDGMNVAPGLNLIYGKETWSVYLTTLYMYNINDNMAGRTGKVDLPNLSMRQGYFEYGAGAVKTWKDISSYVQFVIRSGGRTGGGFQLGLSWKF